MTYLNTFERYETKYMLTKSQKALLLEKMEGRMKLDSYGRTTIRNIYYDTPDMRLIRRSLEKPVYKEKLRVRSYCLADKDSTVFVEIKKKYNDVVYKRRISIKESQAMDWLSGKISNPLDSQISEEIEYMRTFYKGLAPACFLSYEREAFFPLEDSDLRITFDENILARNTNMSLTKGPYGTRIIPDNKTLVEIKSSGAFPVWLTDFLSENRIRKISFSKYGEYYSSVMRNGNEKGGLRYA